MGLLGVFGVVVTLLIPHAVQRTQAFLLSGTEADRQQAVRWVVQIKFIAWLVLVALGFLSVRGLGDAGVRLTVSHTATWLLAAPLFGQIVLVSLVHGLVQRVPKLVDLRLHPPAPMRRSPHGRLPATVINFVNQTSADLLVDWIDFNGEARQYPPAIRPGQARSQPTFAGHVWRVSNPDGPLYLVRAATKPGRVVIEE